MSEKDVPFPYQPLIEGIEKFITDRKDCQKHQDSFLACHLEIRIIIPHNNTKRKIAHHYETYKEPYRSFLEEKQTGNISYCIPIDEQCLYIPWNINFFKNYLLSHKSLRCVYRHIGYHLVQFTKNIRLPHCAARISRHRAPYIHVCYIKTDESVHNNIIQQ